MNLIKFRQPIYRDSKFWVFHYWGYLGNKTDLDLETVIGIKDNGFVESLSKAGHNRELKPSEMFTGLYDCTAQESWAALTEDERAEWLRAGNMPSGWPGREVYEGDNIIGWDKDQKKYEGTIIWCKYVARFKLLTFPCGVEMGIILESKIIGNIHESEGAK